VRNERRFLDPHVISSVRPFDVLGRRVFHDSEAYPGCEDL
jgi:hypothetical protein